MGWHTIKTSRAVDAAVRAISSPLLEDIDISGATGVLVNISGCALIGALAGGGALLPRSVPPSFIREFFIIGICGGYTTFSSFSLQTFQLLESGHGARAIANVLVSVVFCLLATWAGYELARAAV